MNNYPVVTRDEWAQIPRDYKSTWKGKPARLIFEPNVGTTLQVVEIVESEAEKIRRLKEKGLYPGVSPVTGAYEEHNE